MTRRASGRVADSAPRSYHFSTSIPTATLSFLRPARVERASGRPEQTVARPDPLCRGAFRPFRGRWNPTNRSTRIPSSARKVRSSTPAKAVSGRLDASPKGRAHSLAATSSSVNAGCSSCSGARCWPHSISSGVRTSAPAACHRARARRHRRQRSLRTRTHRLRAQVRDEARHRHGWHSRTCHRHTPASRGRVPVYTQARHAGRGPEPSPPRASTGPRAQTRTARQDPSQHAPSAFRAERKTCRSGQTPPLARRGRSHAGRDGIETQPTRPLTYSAW